MALQYRVSPDIILCSWPGSKHQLTNVSTEMCSKTTVPLSQHHPALPALPRAWQHNAFLVTLLMASSKSSGLPQQRKLMVPTADPDRRTRRAAYGSRHRHDWILPIGSSPGRWFEAVNFVLMTSPCHWTADNGLTLWQRRHRSILLFCIK